MKVLSALLALAIPCMAQEYPVMTQTLIGTLHNRYYIYEPQRDITTYELALVTRILVRSLQLNAIKEIDGAPPEVKRHFREVTK